MNAPFFERIAVIGLGLMGGSVARALKERHPHCTVAGCDVSEATLTLARARSAIDTASTDPAQAVSGCQAVILATPLSVLEDTARAIGSKLMPGALVMDVGSVKQFAVQAIAPHLLAQAHFVPAHPIAGSEQSGFSASRADLFEGRRVIVTPEAPLSGDLLQQVNSFWQSLGARVEGMPPAIHDLIFAHVSHLPQLLAFAASHLASLDGSEVMRRFLRLGASDPALWSEIFTLNADPLLAALDRYLDALAHIDGELAQAPDEPQKATGAAETSALFARIASACLITTVMEAERKNGFAFARFGGPGFADFTAPSHAAPEADIEAISGRSAAVRQMLAAYREKLGMWRAGIAAGDGTRLSALPAA